MRCEEAPNGFIDNVVIEYGLGVGDWENSLF